MSNISANIVENVLQDMNYTMKGSKENQRIAWEIKFNNVQKNKKDDKDEKNELNNSEEYNFDKI